MNDKEVLKQLKFMQQVNASDRLHGRIRAMVQTLPSKQAGFSYPLFAFRTAVGLAVLLLILGMGSGMVAAAKLVKPGTPLYPVRQVIEKIPLPVFRPATVTPTTIPTNTPVPTQKEEKKETEQSEKDGSRKDGESVNTSVSPSEENSLDPTQINIPTQEVKGIHIKKDDVAPTISLSPDSFKQEDK